VMQSASLVLQMERRAEDPKKKIKIPIDPKQIGIYQYRSCQQTQKPKPYKHMSIQKRAHTQNTRRAASKTLKHAPVTKAKAAPTQLQKRVLASTRQSKGGTPVSSSTQQSNNSQKYASTFFLTSEELASLPLISWLLIKRFFLRLILVITALLERLISWTYILTVMLACSTGKQGLGLWKIVRLTLKLRLMRLEVSKNSQRSNGSNSISFYLAARKSQLLNLKELMFLHSNFGWGR